MPVTSAPSDAGTRILSLADLARALSGCDLLEGMLELSGERALQALEASSVSISQLQPGTGALRTLLNVGDLAAHEERWPQDEVCPPGGYLQARPVVAGPRATIVCADDADADPGQVHLLRSLGKRCGLTVALTVEGRPWGELHATRGHERERFGPLDVAYAEAMAAILAGALSRAVPAGVLDRVTFRDPLTGLANRRALDEAAAGVLDGAGRRVSVVAVDLGGRSVVEDGSGHGQDEELLAAVTALLMRHFSPLAGSLVARVGHDEFIVLVPGHAVAQVLGAADAFCAAANELSSRAAVSCGVASTTGTQPWETIDHLFRAARLAQSQSRARRVSTAVLGEAAL